MADFFDTVFPGIRERREQRDFERDKRALLLDQYSARSALLGGYDPLTDVTYNGPRPAPKNSATLLDINDITGGVSQGLLQVPTQDGIDYATERRNLAARAFPEAAGARMQAQMFPAAPSLQKLGPGDVLGTAGVDPVTGRAAFNQVAAAPFKPDGVGSDMFQDALLLSGGDQTKAFNLVNQWRNKPATAITMGGDKAVTGVDADRYKGTSQQLAKLDAMAPGLDRMMQSIQNGAKTGFGQEWILPAKQAYEELTGNPLAGTSEQEVLKSLQNFLGPQMRTPGSGSSSDTDVNMFVDSIPTLSKTEEGNRQLADYYGRIRNRTAEILKIQQDLLRENEYIPVDKERAAINALPPLFSAEERNAMKSGRPAEAGKPDNTGKVRVWNPSTGKLE